MIRTRIIRFLFALELLVAVSSSGSAAVQGLVISTAGEPVSGAKVTAYPLETQRARIARLVAGSARSPLATASAGAEGEFALEVPAGSTVQVVAEKDGFALASAILRDQAAPETLALSPASSKTWKVLGSGKPLSGARIVLLSDAGAEVMVTSRGDGTFAVVDPSEWASAIVVVHQDFPITYVGVPDGRAGGRNEIDLDRGRKLEGMVVRDGAPQSGAIIRVADFPYARTDQNGRFVIANAPKQVTTISAEWENYVGVASASGAPIRIELSPGASISGTVQDEKGSAVAGALIHAMSRSGSAQSLTDAKGRFVLRPLARDEYWLGISAPGFEDSAEERRVDVRSKPPADLLVRLKPVRMVHGRVVDSEKKPVGGAFVSIYAVEAPVIYGLFPNMEGTYTRADGTFRLQSAEGSFQYLPTRNPRTVVMAYKKGLPIAHSAPLPSGEEGAAVPELLLTTHQGFEVAGKVTNNRGEAVPNAAILVVQRNDDSGISIPVEALANLGIGQLPLTDPEGEFRIRLNGGIHDFAFRSAGLAPKAVRSVVVSEETEPIHVSLEPGLTLTGRLQRSDGTAVASARVAMQSEQSLTATTETDAKGSFTLEGLTAGDYNLFFIKEDEQLLENRTVTVPSDALVVKLAPRFAVKGRVIASSHRLPVKEFQIRVDSDDSPMLSREPQEFHSEDGTFTLNNVPSGLVTLRVSAEGFAAAEIPVVVEEGSGAEEVLAELKTGNRFRGRVTDREGAPVEGVSVQATQGDRFGGVTSDGSPLTDSEGKFTLENVPPGEVSVWLEKEGFVSKREQVVVADEAVIHEFVMSPGAEIQGVVVGEDGKTLEGVNVAANAAAGEGYGWAETNPDGLFKMAELEPTEYRLEFSKPGFQKTTVKSARAGSEEPLRVVMKAAQTAIITGTVKGVDPNAMMRLVSASSKDGSDSAPIDSTGRYRIEQAPTGTVSVTASVHGNLGSRTVEKTVQVASGAEVRVDFDLEQGYTIRGRVSQDGIPVTGAQVMFNASGGSSTMARSRSAGVYEVRVASPGEYHVYVQSSELGEGFSTTYDVQGSGMFDIDIRRRILSGRVIDAQSQDRIADAEVTAGVVGIDVAHARTTKTDAAGRFTLTVTGEGPVRIRAAREGYGQQLREVDGSSETILQLSRSEGLVVRLVDARSGRPLDGIIVVRDEQNRYAFNGSAAARSDGTIRLPLAPGKYKLSASSNGFATQSVPLTVPTPEVRLALTPGGTLVIESATEGTRSAKLIMPNGDEYIRCECNGIAELKITEGMTTIEHVAPGSYRLQLADGRGFPVVILEGESTAIAIP